MSIFDIPEEMNKIKLKKELNDFMKNIKDETKPETCIICGKKQTSFCKSHSVPQMVLKNIAIDGKVYQANKLIDVPLVDYEKGVANAGVFYFICRECDKKLFQEYENIAALQEPPTEKMLAEIALKDVIQMLSKRNQEKLIFQKVKQSGRLHNVEVMEEIQSLDEKDYLDELKLYEDIIFGDTRNNFKIVLWEKVPYVVPIAAQSLLALTKDLEGTEINNIYDLNPNIRMQNMHIGIFPQNGYSIIYMFYHRRDKAYRRLHHQMNCMTLEKKFEMINYWIFKYTENYYISPHLKMIIEADKKLKELSCDNNGYPNLGYVSMVDYFRPKVNIMPNDITNLLDKKCCLN